METANLSNAIYPNLAIPTHFSGKLNVKFSYHLPAAARFALYVI